MIKIVQLIHGLNMGGAEKIVKDYALGIDRKKFSVTILCYQRLDTPYERLLEEGGISIIYISDMMPFVNKKQLWARLVNRIMRYILIGKELKKLEPDIIHEHLCLSSYIKFARPKLSTVIFYTQHYEVRNWVKYHMKDINDTRWLMRHYKVQMLALNNSMKSEIDQIFNFNKTIVIKPGINIEQFQNKISKECIRTRVNIPQDSFVIGHVGRFSEEKNHKFLVDIFRKIITVRKNAFLLMVGSGVNNQDILDRIKNFNLEKKCLILSNRTDIPDLMNAMDILVFPSISEGLGITLIEAQISGLFCMVSDCVPKETKISNLIKYKSLNDSSDNWAKEIVNWKPIKPIYSDIESWNINYIVEKLEMLYSDAVKSNC